MILSENSKLLILVGPTGVGKSEIAYHLALKLKAEILSADAFQVYKGLAVGTAQPSLSWQKKVKHHLVGTRDPVLGWSAADFAREAVQIIHAARKKAKKLMVVGGAGFYLKALVEGIPPGSSPSPETRQWISKEVERLGGG